jgi:hypothetical protein
LQIVANKNSIQLVSTVYEGEYNECRRNALSQTQMVFETAGISTNTMANNMSNFARDTGYSVSLKKCVNVLFHIQM